MAQQIINQPVFPHAVPHGGDSSELGDNWATLVGKIAAMFNDTYNNVENINPGVAAFPGGGQANATVLKLGVNRVTTVANPGDSVKLPPSVPGARCVVINTTNVAMQVFGDNGASDLINGTPNATGVTQAGPSVCNYICGLAGLWETNDVGDGFSGNFSTVSVCPPAGLTAHAGGGQAAATPCAFQINRFSVVATAADSGLLPPAKHGLIITVINDTPTNAMSLFPCSQAQGGVAGGDQINNLGVNTAFSLAITKTATAYCSVDGKWHIVLSA